MTDNSGDGSSADVVVPASREDVIRGIVETLKPYAEFREIFRTEWYVLAWRLAVPNSMIREMKEGLELRIINLRGVFMKILHCWMHSTTEENYQQGLMEQLDNFLSSYGLNTVTELYEEANAIAAILQENVFSNGVILEEIFCNLGFEDRKSFRLVRRAWREETLRMWRETSVLYLIKFREDSTDAHRLTFQEFFRLFERSEDSGKITNDPYRLIKYPYHRVCLRGVSFPITLVNEWEKFFWDMFGSHLKHLELYKSTFYGLLQSFRWILLSGCKNLTSLSFGRYIYANFGDWDEDFLKGQPLIKDGTMASKLTTLHVYGDDFKQDNDCVKLLNITPNLKSFNVGYGALPAMQGLLSKTVHGTFINLEEFGVALDQATTVLVPQNPGFPPPIFSDGNLHPLRAYIEMSPASLKFKKLSICTELTEAKDKLPTEFILALSHSKCTIEALSIKIERFAGDFRCAWKWLLDFLDVQFPRLTKLTLRLRYKEMRIISVDFWDILNNSMPMLESLSISYIWDRSSAEFYDDSTHYLRKSPRMELKRPPYFTPITLQHLKSFKFSGPFTISDDVKCFQSQILLPNLKSFEVCLGPGVSSSIGPSFPKFLFGVIVKLSHDK